MYTEVISRNDLVTACMWNKDECGNVSVIAHHSYLSTSSYREYTHVRAFFFFAYVCMYVCMYLRFTEGQSQALQRPLKDRLGSCKVHRRTAWGLAKATKALIVFLKVL